LGLEAKEAKREVEKERNKLTRERRGHEEDRNRIREELFVEQEMVKRLRD
jgi:hypothetical protein